LIAWVEGVYDEVKPYGVLLSSKEERRETSTKREYMHGENCFNHSTNIYIYTEKRRNEGGR
jgi:hypothetical protein